MKNQDNIHSIIKAVHRLSRMVILIGGAGGMTAMTMLILCDVAMRSFFNRPIMSSYELVMFLMSIVVFTSFGFAHSEKKIVKIEVVISHLPNKLQNLFDTVTSFLSLGIVALIAWRNFVRCIELQQEGLISPILHIPVYPFYGIAALGFLLLASVIFVNILESFITWDKEE